MYSRTQRVLGEANIERIKNSHLLVLGVGGVGGFVVEMFARLGFGKLTIVDFDKVDKSNLNRQIVALNSTIGQNKVEIMKKRIFDINPNCICNAICEKIEENNIAKILNQNYNFVIDAIDDIKAKVLIAKFCKEKNLNVISSMGTGNRFKIPHFEVSDISKTSYDKLAKKFRKMLKDENIFNLNVVYTKEPVEKTEALGSIVYYPLMCAGTITSFVTNEIIKSI